MKNVFLLALLFLSAIMLQGQISIDKNDIAEAGDTILVSNIANTEAYDYILTDTNYIWNFYLLELNNQEVKKYEEVINVGFIYAAYFADLPFNPNRANMADEGNLSLPALITSSDAFNFYDRNDDEFKQVGIGATLNGIETPYRFINDDKIYEFPLSYGNKDTSFSNYTFRIPSLAGYGYKQKRFNEVDGFGTLITPFDTFEVIRLKSIIRGRDSLYIDSLGFGFEFDRPVITEYKWLAKDKKIPVLQYTIQTVFGNSFVTEAFYQDKKFVPNAVINKKQTDSFSIYPNPTKDKFIIKHNLKNTIQNIALFNIEGKKIDLDTVISNNEIEVSLPISSFISGWHIVRLEIENEVLSQLILILP